MIEADHDPVHCKATRSRAITNPDTSERLIEAARAAARNAYCPYSRFQTGAAVLAEGNTYTGCNVENASYGLTICAERNAVFHAVAAGARRIEAIALTCVPIAPDVHGKFRMPCGACRQVIAEFGSPDTVIHVDQLGSFALSALLP